MAHLPPRFAKFTLAKMGLTIGLDGGMLLSIHDTKDIEWVIAKFWSTQVRPRDRRGRVGWA